MMKTTTMQPFSAALAAALLCIPAAETALAQSKTLSDVRVGRMSAPLDKLDLKFQGGSLTAFLEELQRAHSAQSANAQRCNLLVTGPTEAIKIPAFELRDVRIEDALESVEMVASGQRHRIKVSTKKPRGPQYQPIYIVRIETVASQRSRGSSKPMVRTQVFPTTALTQAARPGEEKLHYSLEAVLGAIESALEINADGKVVEGRKIRHHSSSGLLFVRSTSEEINLVDEVLTTMHGVLADKIRQARMLGMSPRNGASDGAAGKSSKVQRKAIDRKQVR